MHRGFWALHPERSTGWGEGYIPYAAIRLYCFDVGIDDPFEVLPLFRGMDRAYLKYKRDKEEAERERDQRQAVRERILGKR